MSDTDNTSDTGNIDNTGNTQNEADTGKKGRVRRVSKKQQNTETTDSNATEARGVAEAAGASQTPAPKDTDNAGDEAVLPARVDQVATDILGTVLAQTGVTDAVRDTEAVRDTSATTKPVNRRELAAAKARQMRLNSAREFLQTGKLINAKQRLFDILNSAPNSPEADTATDMLLELAAHYETIGQSRWALDLYDDIARYG